MVALEQIKFEIIVHPEYTLVRNAIDSGELIFDRENDRKITGDLESGNEWAWCSVEVKGTLGGLSASDHLGCCNYSDQDDFKNGGYYEDMQEVVRAELQQKVDEVYQLAGLALQIKYKGNSDSVVI